MFHAPMGAINMCSNEFTHARIARSDAKSDKKWLPRQGFLFRCSAIVATVRKGKENAAFQVAALLTRLSDKKK